MKFKLEELEGMQSDMTTYMQIRSIIPDAVNRTHLQRMDRHSKGVQQQQQQNISNYRSKMIPSIEDRYTKHEKINKKHWGDKRPPPAKNVCGIMLTQQLVQEG